MSSAHLLLLLLLCVLALLLLLLLLVLEALALQRRGLHGLKGKQRLAPAECAVTRCLADLILPCTAMFALVWLQALNPQSGCRHSKRVALFCTAN
jgi:hypothetical protein